MMVGYGYGYGVGCLYEGGKWEGEVYEGFSWTRAVNTDVFSSLDTVCSGS